MAVGVWRGTRLRRSIRRPFCKARKGAWRLVVIKMIANRRFN